VQHLLLLSYKAKRPKKKESALDELLDVKVLLEGHCESLKDVIINDMVAPVQNRSLDDIRKSKLDWRLSALLFGPPGTSKTETAKAVASCLGWPYVEITPSAFLSKGLENIYVQADEIFANLMDLRGVVVLFDEMDALVQNRDDPDLRLDITSQFLTTSMLPKLAALHDNGFVVFFMATNFQDRFDAAIKRAGRFDLHLCMWPPTTDSKCERLNKLVEQRERPEDVEKSCALIKEYVAANRNVGDLLSLFTFSECKAFIRGLAGTGSLLSELTRLGQKGFTAKVTEASDSLGLKMKDLAMLQKAGIRWKTLSDLDAMIDFNDRIRQAKKVKMNPTIRYFMDRHLSKRQS